MIGQLVSQYKIVEKLFETDLGIVYGAEDTQHDRPVQFVVLPKAVALNRKAMDRFRASAQVASSIPHPNICAVYEVGEFEERPFIAMELLEGQSLGHRIAEKPLRMEEILDLGSQVVEALEAAHAKGTVYREITPANIYITKHGTAKLLDLELAKLLGERLRSDKRQSASPDRGAPPTSTAGENPPAAYMSPEQVRGEQLDVRSDIFSFGAVLYQMATGKRAFQGGAYDAIVAEVLNRPVTPPARPDRSVSPGFWHVVNKALEKERDLRYQTAGEMLRDLHRLMRDSASTEAAAYPAAAARVARRASRRRWIQATAVALLIVLLVPLGWYVAGLFRAPLRVSQFVSLPGYKDHPKFSPDGKQVAFEWNGEDGSNRDIYVKRSGSGKPFRLTSDPGDDAVPVWSPDGRQIAFVRESGGRAKIYIIPSEGGPERALITTNGPVYLLDEFIPALAWSPDGKWLAFSEKSTEDGPVRVMLVATDTKETRPLTAPPPGISGDFWPVFSPDGGSVVFVRKMRFGVNDLWIQNLSQGEARQLTQKEYLSCEGTSWTADGHGVVFSAALAGDYPRIWCAWIGGSAPEPIQGLGANAGPPSVLKQQMVYAQTNGQGISIWRLPGLATPVANRTPARLIASNGDDANPRFSPDGARIAFESTRSGTNQIWVCASDGSGQVRLTNLGGYSGAPSWSPDGSTIAFDSTGSGNREIWIVDSRGGSPRRMTSSPARDLAPSFSRDGKWLYFSSDRSGMFQLWRMPSQGGEAVQVTSNGGFYAIESYGANHLYYSQRNRSGIWRVPVGGGEETRVLNRPVNWTDWSLSPGGILYLARRPGRNGESFAIGYLEFNTGKVSEVYRSEGPSLHGWLSVSPDDRWILYSEVPKWEVNIMLAENLRLKSP